MSQTPPEGGPRDWAVATAGAPPGTITGLRLVPSGAGAPAPTGTLSPEEVELEKERQREAARAAREELADIRAERERRARRRRIEDDIEEVKLQRLLRNGGREPDPEPSPSAGARLQGELAMQFNREREGMLERIDRLTEQVVSQRADTQTAAVQRQLDELRVQVASIGQGQGPPGSGPISQLVSAFEDLKRVRTVMDEIAPPPAPPPLDPGLTNEQRIAQDRMNLEHDIRIDNIKLQRETLAARREELQADIAFKQARLDRLVAGLESALGPLAAAVAGGGLANLFGGGDSGNDAAPALAAPAQPEMIHYPCPNCHAINYVAAGTDVTSCPHCQLAPIRLRPPGSPPPPGMVAG
jgi:hypothetical protein